MTVALGNNQCTHFIPSAISVPAQTKCYQNYKKNLDNNTKSEQNNEFCFVRFLYSIREIMEKNLSYLLDFYSI
ncbi:hypothetical protein D8787_00380 [Streptococcus mitis]|uniref:Uncharacterized protein n=1 Tax=Streptococcus mitis TaxID=28037 RepID=A0A428I678_STRMT|nr:hypothetical protein D8787_00380 [Streptococcus mitis]